jgi:hypothetical protein
MADASGEVIGKVQSVSRLSGAKPVDLRIKRPPVNILAMVVKAIGGTPLAEHLVRIVDPDTGEPVGDPVRSGADGKIRARVPEKKAYAVEILDEGPLRTVPGVSGAPKPQPEAHVLSVLFVDGAGQPAAGEPVKLTPDFGDPLDVKTDGAGLLDLPRKPGLCKLDVRGQTFWAHPIPFSRRDGPAYRFVLT